jgi:hypothetical protein
MQATFALIDWLAQRMPADLNADPWSDLSQPFRSGVAQGAPGRRRAIYVSILRNLLNQSQLRDEFETFLVRAIGVSSETAKALQWEPPRAVIMEAAPALLRRLERDWKWAGETTSSEFTPWSPLPEFLPGALFSDLQLPEVSIRTGTQASANSDGDEMMAIGQALREFAPGRVSRRFGVAHKGLSHWIDPGAGTTLSIDPFCAANDRLEVGYVTFLSGAKKCQVRVVRPHNLSVTNPPVSVQQSSNATLEWRVEVMPSGDGSEGALPDRSPWSGILTALRVHSHGLGTPVELRRCAPAVTVMEARKGIPAVERHVTFVASRPDNSVEPVALGFVVDVDAVQVVFRYPPNLHASTTLNERLCRGLRLSRFGDLLRDNAILDGLANRFQRDWLSQVYLSAITGEALSRGCSLEEAEVAVANRDAEVPIERVLETILQIDDPDEDAVGQTGGAPSSHREPPRRLREVGDLLHRSEVQTALHDASFALWEPLDAKWEPWLRGKFRATLGAALVEGARQLCPRMDADALVVDVDVRPQLREEQSHDSEDELWLTEATIGGGGFVEEFHQRFSEDPRRFLRFVEAALLPSDLEAVDNELARIVSLLAPGVGQDSDFVAIVDALRLAESHTTSASALRRLRTSLAERGIQPTPTLLVSLNARVVRPGTNQRTDALTSKLLEEWTAAEARLGVDIDVRVLALAKSGDSALEIAIGARTPEGSEEAIRTWRYSTLCGMLWPRGTQVRSQALVADNQFTPLPETDRLLLLSALLARQQFVDVTSSAWFEAASSALVSDGTVVVHARDADAGVLVRALLTFATQAIDAGAVLVYARVVGISRDGGRIMAAMELPEALQ